MLKGLSVSNFSVQILMIDDTYQFSKVTTDCIERIANNLCFLKAVRVQNQITELPFFIYEFGSLFLD